jgi:hypothetical protein
VRKNAAEARRRPNIEGHVHIFIRDGTRLRFWTLGVSDIDSTSDSLAASGGGCIVWKPARGLDLLKSELG